jgi:Fic family protein
MDCGHLLFKNNWSLGEEAVIWLGECVGLIDVLRIAPLSPEDREALLRLTIKRGALSTTAIEGNSVTEEEYDAFVQKKRNLPPSRRYQQIEVENLVSEFNRILSEGRKEYVTSDLIKDFHRRVVKGLNEELQVVPGVFREHEVSVGGYRPPDHGDVSGLVERLCMWLREFGFSRGQSAAEMIIEALVAHVYFVWIHPFGDGNGRTGRLLEFYLLMRGGFPSIAGHILSNFYNNTRDKYYKMLEVSRLKKNISDFLIYAIGGLRDGLREMHTNVAYYQTAVLWKDHIYRAFDTLQHSKEGAFLRKRELMLGFPLYEGLLLEEIPLRAGVLKYGGLSANTLYKDIMQLQELGLLVRREDKRFYANWQELIV